MSCLSEERKTVRSAQCDPFTGQEFKVHRQDIMMHNRHYTARRLKHRLCGLVSVQREEVELCLSSMRELLHLNQLVSVHVLRSLLMLRTFLTNSSEGKREQKDDSVW